MPGLVCRSRRRRVGEVELLRLAQLCRDMQTSADRCRRANRIDDLGQQQARHDARIEAAGPMTISSASRWRGRRPRSQRRLRRQPDPVDCRAASDLRLADDLTASSNRAWSVTGVPVAGTTDLAPRGHGSSADRFLEVAPGPRNIAEQQVADRVPAQFPTRRRGNGTGAASP